MRGARDAGTLQRALQHGGNENKMFLSVNTRDEHVLYTVLRKAADTLEKEIKIHVFFFL